MSPSRGSEKNKNDSSWQVPDWSFFKNGRETLLEDGYETNDNHSNNNNNNNNNKDGGAVETETSPYKYRPEDSRLSVEKGTTIAACFLMDYEAGRPPKLSPDFQRITDEQLQFYKIKFSRVWDWLGLKPAILLLFVSYFKSRLWTALIHSYAVGIFLFDLYMRDRIFPEEFKHQSRANGRYFHQIVRVFLIVLGLQSWCWFFLSNPERHFSTLISSLFKPLVFFYWSRRARDALEALLKITNILARVLVIELFLILTFAAVACRLYYKDENFSDLATSWLSLFELSTTVVSPSIWMPLYARNHFNAIFFIIFIIISVFYLHSLILAVVFQVFIKAATVVHRRKASDKEHSLRLAYLALLATNRIPLPTVDVYIIRATLEKLRPHYSRLKLNVLMEILDPTAKRSVDYTLFRARIQEVLNSSIRSSRTPSVYKRFVEVLSVVVTLVNFLYVILLTSHFRYDWFDATTIIIGSLITAAAILELCMRVDLSRMTYYPMTRLNSMFDWLALTGAIVSLIDFFLGICRYAFGDKYGAEYILTGRAIDMIRTMRFFAMFRDIVERSVNVLPALSGPIFLVLTTVHVAVYLGMVLWGGAIDTAELAQRDDIMYLYYLNNFNTYGSGLLTIFNILVINDWHEIAQVFLHANRNAQVWIVYPVFICIVLIAVCIMLNLITAFFVETFVTRMANADIDRSEIIQERIVKDFSIQTSKKRDLKQQFSWGSMIGTEDNASKDSSQSSEGGEVVEFDIFEREGFDQIMQTVSNTTDKQDIMARCLRDTMDIVGSFSPDWDNIGLMVCCQKTLSQYGNNQFHRIAQEFLNYDSLQELITDVNISMCASRPHQSSGGKRLLRQFLHPNDPSTMLEIFVMALPHQPKLTLIIARKKTIAGDFISSKPISGDNMPPISFTGDNMTSLSFAGDNMRSTSFAGDNMRSTSFVGDNMRSTSFAGDNMRSTSFIGDNIPSISFAGDNIPSISFAGDNMPSTSFAGDNMPSISFAGDNMPSISFSGDNMPSISFARENILSTSFARENIPSTSFARENMPSIPIVEDNIPPILFAGDNTATTPFEGEFIPSVPTENSEMT